MAVFTELDAQDIASILSHYELSDLHSFSPISSGIENTNYFVSTGREVSMQHWVLTLFENLQSSELPYFVALTEYLAAQGLSVPAPLRLIDGNALFQFAGKYGVLVPRLDGRALTAPGPDECAELGQWMAELHRATLACPLWREAPRGRDWIVTHATQVLPFLSEVDRQLMQTLLSRLDAYRAQLDVCPKGLIHGDLFRDNVLFTGGRISGVIDFYHSCYAPLVFDLAVAINDWKDEVSILQGYRRTRVLGQPELDAMPAAKVLAAWQFWLSRLMTRHQPGYQNNSTTGEVEKDPDEMKCLILALLTSDRVKSG